MTWLMSAQRRQKRIVKLPASNPALQQKAAKCYRRKEKLEQWILLWKVFSVLPSLAGIVAEGSLSLHKHWHAAALQTTKKKTANKKCFTCRRRMVVSIYLSGKLPPVFPDAAGCRTRSSPQARMMPKRCKDITLYQSAWLAYGRQTCR